MKAGSNGAPDDRADENSETVEQPGGVLDAPDPAQQEAEWQVALKQATQAAQISSRRSWNRSSAVRRYPPKLTPKLHQGAFETDTKCMVGRRNAGKINGRGDRI
jgi:hypothetical protein